MAGFNVFIATMFSKITNTECQQTLDSLTMRQYFQEEVLHLESTGFYRDMYHIRATPESRRVPTTNLLRLRDAQIRTIATTMLDGGENHHAVGTDGAVIPIASELARLRITNAQLVEQITRLLIPVNPFYCYHCDTPGVICHEEVKRCGFCHGWVLIETPPNEPPPALNNKFIDQVFQRMMLCPPMNDHPLPIATDCHFCCNEFTVMKILPCCGQIACYQCITKMSARYQQALERQVKCPYCKRLRPPYELRDVRIDSHTIKAARQQQ